MGTKKFSEIVTMAEDRIGESSDGLETADINLIKDGINQGYMIISETVDKQLTSINEPFASVISMPADFIEIESIEHEYSGILSENDYKRIANSDNIRILNPFIDENGELTINYFKFPAVLSADSDVIVVQDTFSYAIATYGAYYYMLRKKKYSAAQLLQNEFNTILGINNSDQGNEQKTS